MTISGGPPQQPPLQGYCPPPQQQGGYQPVPGGPPPPHGYYLPPPEGGAYPTPPGGAYPPPQGGPYPPQGQAYPVIGTAREPVKGQEQGVVYEHQPTSVVVYAQDELDSVSDYMIANILACLMCCWCIGCCAIMKSKECQDAKRSRDLDAAKRYSASAKKLLIATTVAGFVAFGIYIICYVLFILNAIH